MFETIYWTDERGARCKQHEAKHVWFLNRQGYWQSMSLEIREGLKRL